MWTNLASRNQCWAFLLVEELVRAGVCAFVLSPGSRSTPLTLAVATHPSVPRVMHFDERGAAFHALGWARATRRPAALVCTSGSAVANYFPAVVEAAQSHTPLILLTADRPPELLNCGANQAVDQVKLFGGYVREFLQLPCPTAEIDPAFVLTTADQAVQRAQHAPAGPVHINCAFREPLAPAQEDFDAEHYLAPLLAWRENNAPYTTCDASLAIPGEAMLERLEARIASTKRGLLVIGGLQSPGERDAVAAFARRLGWPACADIASGLRQQSKAPFLPHVDHLLLSEGFREQFQPDTVLHLGGAITSKRLWSQIAAVRLEYIRVANHPERHDPQHHVTWRIEADLTPFCAHARVADACGTAWHALARQCDQAAAAAIAEDPEMAALNEISVARAVSALAPDDSVLFLANSMPIRDMDMMAAPREDAPWVCVSRGASGIDGNLATAAGIARAARKPTVAVLGDLALLHDLNSLALLRGLEPPFVIVVINNDGGGIFHFLPVAQHQTHFERYFVTPHGLCFAEAAAMFGLGYTQPGSLEDFTAALKAAPGAPTPVIVEVRTERKDNHEVHRALQTRVAEAVERALP